VTVLVEVGLFTTYTYISPILTTVAGFAAPAVSGLLALFGMGALIGNLIGGRLADRCPWRSLLVLIAALATTEALFALTSHGRLAAAVTVLALGVVAFALVPALQTRVLAETPAAPTLAVATNTSAFNLGIAGGSFLGGRLIDSTLGLTGPAWVGGLVVLGALGLAGLIARGQRDDAYHPPVRETRQPAVWERNSRS
jgi:MFS transporter, DHA1 family, inner membrane transport protein